MTDFLSSDEPRPFTKQNARKKKPFLIVNDHGSSLIPRRLNNLGLSEAERRRHIALDIGSRGVAERLAAQTGAGAILANYSRLVIDLNRAPLEPTAIPTTSDGTLVPGNLDLSPEQIQERYVNLYYPYHEVVERELELLEEDFEDVLLVAIHSFTPRLSTEKKDRPWHIGLLWKNDPETTRDLREYLQKETDFAIGDNEPYSLFKNSCATIQHHAEAKARRSLMIEIRQDLIEQVDGQARLASILSGFFEKRFEETLDVREDQFVG